MTAVRRNYRDALFCFIFGRYENRNWTLELYNAVNGSQYSDPETIEISTIEQVLFLGKHNDVSFLITGSMNLYEEQSSWNPNMPLRFMQYCSGLYEKFLKTRNLNKYGRERLLLPVPRLVVFYMGSECVGEEVFLRLSDSFPADAEPDIEVTVRVLNISPGHNQELLLCCRPLREYVWFVEMTERKVKQGMDLRKAIHQTIDEMPDDYEIKPALIAHRAEMNDIIDFEWSEEEIREAFKADGWRAGRQEGREEGREEG